MSNQNNSYNSNPREYFSSVFHNVGQDARQQLEIYFGKADAKTQEFRERCNDLGFSVVFSQGLSMDEQLRILGSPETTRILASN